jgi:hypothetical protein
MSVIAIYHQLRQFLDAAEIGETMLQHLSYIIRPFSFRQYGAKSALEKPYFHDDEKLRKIPHLATPPALRRISSLHTGC